MDEFIAPLADQQPVDEPAFLTEDQMFAKLQAEVEAAGSQSVWADAHGVSRQMLCEILQGNRSIRGLMAAAMGYRLVITFERIED